MLDIENKVLTEGEITISILPEISTEKLVSKDVDDLMNRTRNQMIQKYNEISKLKIELLHRNKIRIQSTSRRVRVL